MKLLPAFTGDIDVNRIYNVDSLTLLNALAPNSVDLVVTSPPYNMRTTLNGAEPSSKSDSNWGNSKLLTMGYGAHGDNMPYPEYVAWQRSVLTACMRVLKDDGAIFYNHKWRIQAGILEMRSAIVEGFPVRQVIIWDRGMSNNHNRAFFAPSYEVIYLIAKRGFYIRQDATKYGDVWHIPPASGNEHPAPFPEMLAERCILSTDARLIVDPFMGSGTTAVVAQRLGRQYIGCDIELSYCEQARRRLANPFMLPMFAEGGAA